MSLLSRTLIGASIPFVLLILYIAVTQKPMQTSIPLLDIGIEHKQTMTLTVTLTENDRLRMIDVGNDAVEPIALSVPEDWTRGEVRGAPLKTVTSEAPSFGYIRWHIPAKATVSFHTDHPFAQLNVHNPSAVPLKIRLTTVDLEKNTGDHEVYLVKDGAVAIP